MYKHRLKIYNIVKLNVDLCSKWAVKCLSLTPIQNMQEEIQIKNIQEEIQKEIKKRNPKRNPKRNITCRKKSKKSGEDDTEKVILQFIGG